MIQHQNNTVIENSEGKLTVTVKEESLQLEISKDALGIPYGTDLSISIEDAKELTKVLSMYLDED